MANLEGSEPRFCFAEMSKSLLEDLPEYIPLKYIDTSGFWELSAEKPHPPSKDFIGLVRFSILHDIHATWLIELII